MDSLGLCCSLSGMLTKGTFFSLTVFILNFDFLNFSGSLAISSHFACV